MTDYQSLYPAASRRVWTVVCMLLFLASLLGGTKYCARKPMVGSDSFFYASLVQDGTTAAFRDAVREAYSKASPTGMDINDNRDGTNTVGESSQRDFAIVCRFYTIKPLYIAVGKAIRAIFHVTPLMSLQIISVASYVLIGFSILLFLQQYMAVSTACLCSIPLLFFSTTSTLGRMVLPDSLSTALLLMTTAIVVATNWRMPIKLAILILIALVRPDNIVFAVIWGAMLLWRQPGTVQTRLRNIAILVVVCALFHSISGQMTHALSFAALFNYSFMLRVQPDQLPFVRLRLLDYLRIDLNLIPRVILEFFPLPLIFSSIVLIARKVPRELRDLVIASIVTALVRLPLFPQGHDRLFSWFLLLSALCALATAGQKHAVGQPHTSASPLPEPQAA